MTEQNIPESVQNICKEICKAARDQGLYEFSGKFRPDYSVWCAEVSFSWKRGRHEEDWNKIQITSTHFVHTNIDKL